MASTLLILQLFTIMESSNVWATPDEPAARVEITTPYLPASAVKKHVPGIEVKSFSHFQDEKKLNHRIHLSMLDKREKSLKDAALEMETMAWDEFDKDTLYLRASRYQEDRLIESYPNIDRLKLINLKRIVLDLNRQNE